MVNTVLITTSGIGERLGNITKYTNKSLVKVGDKYAICYIIENYPLDTEFIITIGYFGDYVKDFLIMAYPNHSFIFVTIDVFAGPGSSLGYSLLQARAYLQKPFIFHCCDAVITQSIDIVENQNTLYVFPCENSEQYTNVIVDDETITAINAKKHPFYDYIYTGISYIHNYGEFWENLHETYISNPQNTALSDVDALRLLLTQNKIVLKYKVLPDWYDTGNMQSYAQLNDIIKPKFCVLEKNYESLCFFENNNKQVVIKFINDKSINEKRVKRGEHLFPLTPEIIAKSDNFMCMKFVDGQLLSETTNYNEIYELLCWAKQFLWVNPQTNPTYIDSCRRFYIDKTISRINQLTFIHEEKNTINQLTCSPILDLIKRIPDEYIVTDTFCNFHGDFILDNIIKTGEQTPINKYKLLDWRHEFDNNQLEWGDVYYDLAKLRHNIIFNHDNIKNHLFKIVYNAENVTVDLKCNYLLMNQLTEFDKFVLENNYDLTKIKILTAIIWLNMSPLYENALSEFLFYFGKYNLQLLLLSI